MRGKLLFRTSTTHRRSESSVLDHSLRSTHNQKSAIAKQRVIKMLIVVVIIFFCCWTPSYIWWLLLMAGDSFEVREYILYLLYLFRKVSYVLSFLNVWDIIIIQSLQLSVWNSDLNTFITLLTYLSSCTNPITYCFLNKKFRNAIYATFGRKKVLRHHFQKVYFPVNVHSPQLPNNNEKHHINRSASSNCNRPHQVGSEWKMTRSISSTTSNPLNISTHYSLVRQNGISPSKSRGKESMI
uniref:G_PROTEIN_RECEP_F1_2 domain-containing protein n=1 Tax=Heterorhabditis bacteriophora TaxID=37862 RepID=A0A1I7X722_HETBA